ncbi:hypothetical protein ACFWA5_26820 [Streptomyces mirabilis]
MPSTKTPVGRQPTYHRWVLARRIEECFQAAKNEWDLDQYEVRRYVGW